MPESTYTNITPSAKDLRKFTYSEEYWYVEQDWDMVALAFKEHPEVR